MNPMVEQTHILIPIEKNIFARPRTSRQIFSTHFLSRRGEEEEGGERQRERKKRGERTMGMKKA